MNAPRRKSHLDATVEVRADDTRTAAQQQSDITHALTQAGFTVNDLVLYSRDERDAAQP